MDEDEDGTLGPGGLIAIALAIIAWVSFLVAFLVASDPFLYLLFALLCGGAALALGLRAKREEQAAAAVGGAAAGAALLYGVSVVAALTALVYATGVLMMLVLLFFLALMFAGPSASSGSGVACGGGSSGGGGGGCCCEDCCDDCCTDCGGACCECGCGDCGGCDCGGCGGCGCIGFGMVVPPIRAPRRFFTRDRFAHHPDTPAFAADVYLVRGLRLCVGCFTTYPVFLLASALLVAFTPPSGLALLAGVALAGLQGLSSAGLARTRALKATVKTALGLGLALVVSGIHSAAWPPAAKVAALLGVLALAWLSALPRARRMRKARGAHVHEHQAVAPVASSSGP
ncbi:MAG TPA: hypothetical protein VFH78_05240 [Candidatus Thermoplasmatota archaeon]|nr:hypothetical protein [Candidatus Thermoplasmatota archaeon]